MSSPVREGLAAVRTRIANAAVASGRRAEDVRLIAVTKTVPVATIADALAAGQDEFGENRAQELLDKVGALAAGSPAPTWHFVGRLQRNKVRKLAPHVACWHSIDSPELGRELARHARGARVLVQVNIAGETQKGGCEPEAVPALVDQLVGDGLDVVGLMTVPPITGDARPHFASLRSTADRLGLTECSMGMTDDFEAAISEGATMVRVGSAIFGARRGSVGLRR